MSEHTPGFYLVRDKELGSLSVAELDAEDEWYILGGAGPRFDLHSTGYKVVRKLRIPEIPDDMERGPDGKEAEELRKGVEMHVQEAEKDSPGIVRVNCPDLGREWKQAEHWGKIVDTYRVFVRAVSKGEGKDRKPVKWLWSVCMGGDTRTEIMNEKPTREAAMRAGEVVAKALFEAQGASKYAG